MKLYTCHAETKDGTLHDAFSAHPSKRMALRVITGLSKMTTIDNTVRYVVCDEDGMTVATKEVKSH